MLKKATRGEQVSIKSFLRLFLPQDLILNTLTPDSASEVSLFISKLNTVETTCISITGHEMYSQYSMMMDKHVN